MKDYDYFIAVMKERLKIEHIQVNRHNMTLSKDKPSFIVVKCSIYGGYTPLKSDEVIATNKSTSSKVYKLCRRRYQNNSRIQYDQDRWLKIKIIVIGE